MLARASDWELRFDLAAPKYGQHKRPQFPIEVVEALQIPDGVIWSTSAKTVIWIELTCPWEENMTTWHYKKMSNYNQIKIDAEARGWNVYPLYVEVGCRGYVGKTFDYVKRVLGFTKAEARQLKQTMEYTALLCSYTIFNH